MSEVKSNRAWRLECEALREQLEAQRQERISAQSSAAKLLDQREEARKQVALLRTDLKTAADYLDQTAACNSDKAISSQFRKTLTATEPK